VRLKFSKKMKWDLEQLVTAKRAAEIIGVTEARIRQLIAAGSLPSIRLTTLVDPEDLKQFAEPPRRGGKPRKGKC